MRIERRAGARRTTVALTAGENAEGEPIREEVVVDDLGYDLVRVVRTPGIVLGLAAQDLIEVDRQQQTFEIRERGGNFAVQVYGPTELAEQVAHQVRAMGGSLDGRATELTVYTVPATVGLTRLEELFDAVTGQHPELEWVLGNAYAEDGVTPLRWWEG